MNPTLWYLIIGSVIAVAAVTRTLLTRDLVGRLVAVNVVGVGAFLIILALAIRSGEIDPVLTALVITGLVIASAFTGLGAVLIRRIEDPQATAVSEQSGDGDMSDDEGTTADSPGAD